MGVVIDADSGSRLGHERQPSRPRHFDTPPCQHDPMTTDHTPHPEQLELLEPPQVPPQFRLSRDTRERGLAHVAELRRLLRAQRPDQAA